MKQTIICLIFFSFTTLAGAQNHQMILQGFGGPDAFTVTFTYGNTEYTVTGGSKSANRMVFGIPSTKNSCGIGDLMDGAKKYGYVDTTGAWVIQPQYDDARDFSGGYGIVMKCRPDGSGYYSWHILPNGERLYPQNYVDVTPFAGDYATADKDGAYHYCHINKKGVPLYSQTYPVLGNFNSFGKAVAIRNISLSTGTCTWVVLNTKGVELYSVRGKYDPDVMPDSLNKYLGS